VRVEILAAAADLFRARGYRATTLEELARRLGISKKTLYGHFRSKEDLLAAIFHRTMTLVEDGLATIRASRAAPAEQLREVIRHQVRTVVAEQAFLTVFFAEEASLPMRLRRAIARRKARYDHAVQAIVRRCGPLGVHPRLVVFALLGMSNWTHRWYDPRGRWDEEFIAEAFITLIERGYRAAARADDRDLVRRLDELNAQLRGLRPFLQRHGRSRRGSATGPGRYLRAGGRGSPHRMRRR
jgi:TetR/AcrR family transcriptional regulator, cholesterol catabolism regulator